MYQPLKDYQATAIQRAEKLTKTGQDNPSTQVHELVKYLNSQS
ncbi:RloB family protein [Planktothricoides raciborskii]|nr:RloB family protein [Planktothricoides raciborskii]